MKFQILFLFGFLATCPLRADDSFETGSGSQFNLTTKTGASADLSIYVSESSFSKVGIEYFFTTKGLIAQKMWQQFVLKIVDKGPLILESGFVKTTEMTKPEKLTDEYLFVNDGVQVNDFLFSNEEELKPFFISTEQVELPAGTVSAKHYTKKNGPQTIDFWISDDAKPIGLVKLVSSHTKSEEQNYRLELVSLLREVKREIDPKQAVELTDKGKSMLATPLKK